MVTEFLLALQFLTILRVKRALPFDAETFGRAGAFFPLVGFLLGAVVWALDRGLQPVFPATVCSILIVIALAVLSRGLHLDGLADSADGLLGGRDRQRRLDIMKDSAIGTFGALALVGVLLLKVRALDVLPHEDRAGALLLAPVLGRWACVALAYGTTPAHGEGLGALFIAHVHRRAFLQATLLAALLALPSTGPFGVLLLAVVGSLTLGWARYCTSRIGGATGDTLGAVGELGETVTLCLFASRATGRG